MRMAPEYRQKGSGFVVGLTLNVHLAIDVMKEGEHIQGAMTDILEFLEPLAHRIGLQIRCQPLEDLDTRTLVKEDQVRWGSVIKADEVLHLGKEVGISDVQEIAGSVRLQSVALQYTMQRGFARRRTDCGRVHLQAARGPSQCPSSATGQGLGLTVKRHDPQPDRLRVAGRTP